MADVVQLRKEFEAVKEAESKLPSGPQPPDNDGMEHRITALETRLDTILPTLATKGDVGELRTELHKGFGDMVKWIVITAFAGLAAVITIMTFVLNNAVPKLPPPVAGQQPIIINIPGASQPAPQAPPKR